MAKWVHVFMLEARPQSPWKISTRMPLERGLLPCARDDAHIPIAKLAVAVTAAARAAADAPKRHPSAWTSFNAASSACFGDSCRRLELSILGEANVLVIEMGPMLLLSTNTNSEDDAWSRYS